MKFQKSHLAYNCTFRHLITFKDLSLFLLGSPQRGHAEGSEHLVPTLDTLIAHLFPTTLPTQCRELSHLLFESLVEILQVTRTAPLHKQSLCNEATPKCKTMSFVSREVGWQRSGHLERRNRNFFLNFSFGASWLQILQVPKERYVCTVRTGREPVIHWPVVCVFNSWITGSITAESSY